MRIRFIRLIRCFYFLHPNNLCASVKSVGEYAAINSVSSVCSVGECYYWRGLQRVQFLLGWCSSCSVGAALARLVHLRQVHPLSVPPFAFAVRSVSVRRPIGFRPPSDQIPSAVRLDSVRRRWKSVGKNFARTLCSTAILSATSPSLTWAYFVVFIIRTLTICVFVWNLWEDHCLLGWCTSCSGKRQSRAETSAPPKIASEICGRILSNKFYEFCVFCGRKLSSKFCEFCVFCGRPFRQTFDEIVLFCPISQAFRKKRHINSVKLNYSLYLCQYL